MTTAATAWFAARRGNLYILAEQSMGNKVFVQNLDNQEFSIIKRGKKTVLGELLNIGLSPETLLEDLDIREGDKILLLPVSRSRVAVTQLAP